EQTNRRGGSLAGSLRDHHDPKVRSVATSALTQVPNLSPPPDPLLLASPPHISPTCGQAMPHDHTPTLAALLQGLPQASTGLSNLEQYKPGAVLRALAEVFLNAQARVPQRDT